MQLNETKKIQAKQQQKKSSQKALSIKKSHF